MNTFSLLSILLCNGLALQAALRTELGIVFSRRRPAHAGEELSAAVAMGFWLAVGLVILFASL